MYSVEWQKRGLPHVHILVWLIDKIRPEEIDNIISAEIPSPSTDRMLFDIVTANMIYGPCVISISHRLAWLMESVLKIFQKISLTIRSQMLTVIQYIVEEIPIIVDNHLLKLSTT